MNRIDKQRGFTLIELIIIMGIISILMGVASISLFSVRNQTSLSSTVQNVITDIKQQQLKAMVGDSESRASADTYGIHFDTTRYTLFHGTSYNPADSTNFTIDLPPDQMFSSVTFPSGNVIFLQMSGEISGYGAGQDTITVRDSAGNQKTIHLNAYGTITQVD